MTIFSACFSAASVKVTVKVYKNDNSNVFFQLATQPFYISINGRYINLNTIALLYVGFMKTLFHRLFCFINEIAFVLMNLLKKKTLHYPTNLSRYPKTRSWAPVPWPLPLLDLGVPVGLGVPLDQLCTPKNR